MDRFPDNTNKQNHVEQSTSSGVAVPVTEEHTKKLVDKLSAWCTNQAASGALIRDLQTNCPADLQKTGGCQEYIENAILKVHPDIFCRRSENLLIRYLNGHNEVLQDKTDDQHVETFETFHLTKYFPDIQYGLIYRGFYEGGTYDLIDLKSGTRTNVGGDVVLSPGKGRLAVYFSDLEATFSPNVLAVYWVTPNGLVEEFRGQPQEWGPDDLKWTDDQTIEFNKVTFTGVGFNKERHKLRFIGNDISKQGSWNVDGDLKVDKERMQIKLSDIERLAIPNSTIVSVIPTTNGAQVTAYGLSNVDLIFLEASLAGLYHPIRIKAPNPLPLTSCGRTFSKVVIDIEGDPSSLVSKQHTNGSPVLIKTKEGGVVECAFP